MSYCLNPDCRRPQNLENAKFCQTCGSKLLLRGHYRAIKPIGHGGFGKTFLAIDEDKPSKPRCVIKQFSPQTYAGGNAQKAVELFDQEAVRLDELGKHPFIPELLAYFKQDGHQYLMQEFIDGQNLAQILETQGNFSEPQIWDLLSRILPMLEFIHSRKVIHRDIKPENIIRHTDQQLYLVDFGAAKLATATALLQTGTKIGTPEYVAPEQLKGKAEYPSDLYSLGVTCIHLLTGVSPFDLFDINEDTWVWRQYLGNRSVSGALGRVLDKLIENALNRRYQSVVEVLKDLNMLPRAAPVGSQATQPATPQPRGVNLPPTTQPWKGILTLKGHNREVNAAAFSPDGKTIASGSNDGSIKLWRSQDGTELMTLDGLTDRGWLRRLLFTSPIYAVAFSPDGQTIAGGTNGIKLWQTRNGQPTTTPPLQTGLVYAVAFSPNGETLATGGADGAVRLWQWKEGLEIRTLIPPNILEPRSPVQLYSSTGVHMLAFSPDGEILVSCSTRGLVSGGIVVNTRMVHLWRVKYGQLALSLTVYDTPINFVAFNGDGLIFASDVSDTVSQERRIRLWRLGDGREIGSLRGHTSGVNAIGLSSDWQAIVTCHTDRTLQTWHSP